ncbi:MAG: hypothetical protein GTO02_16515 [Candidatus Dadabacteria bacterium]|nr:hypothetical protein [Candidatus Dadabacteria bacterium]
MGKVYLYLLRRDKKDVKIVGCLSSSARLYPTRLTDLDWLGLAAHERLELATIAHEHRAEWEVWLESAENYSELKDSLEKRRVMVPSSPNAYLINFAIQEIPKTTQIKLNKNRVMTRRMN